MRIHYIPGKNEGAKRRVAVYCRVSTASDGQADSLHMQAQAYKIQVAEHKDWELTQIYADSGKSGRHAESRPEFMRMLQDAQMGKFNLLLVKSISRFSRNIVDCQRYAQLLRGCGVEIRFEKEGLSTANPAGEMMFSLLGIIAQDESRSLSENVKWTYRQNFSKGCYHLGNNRMLGYDTDEQGKLVPNGDAWIIERIFKMFAAGYSYKEICDHLNAAGARRLRSSKPWNTSAIQCIVRNESYVGDKQLQKQPPRDYMTGQAERDWKSYYLHNDHDPIIDRNTWNQVQKRLNKT